MPGEAGRGDARQGQHLLERARVEVVADEPAGRQRGHELGVEGELAVVGGGRHGHTPSRTPVWMRVASLYRRETRPDGVRRVGA